MQKAEKQKPKLTYELSGAKGKSYFHDERNLLGGYFYPQLNSLSLCLWTSP